MHEGRSVTYFPSCSLLFPWMSAYIHTCVMHLAVDSEPYVMLAWSLLVQQRFLFVVLAPKRWLHWTTCSLYRPYQHCFVRFFAVQAATSRVWCILTLSSEKGTYHAHQSFFHSPLKNVGENRNFLERKKLLSGHGKTFLKEWQQEILQSLWNTALELCAHGCHSPWSCTVYFGWT